MSFQGDVAGIGLGELLQGLARGERNGVLTLTGKQSTSCVGLRKGQLYLLPGNAEDDALWRDRCIRAYAESPDPNLESARRSAIARATRLENFYQMIEADNLHFRFDPGQLPPPPSAALRGEHDSHVIPGHKSIAFDDGGAQEYEPEHEEESPWGPGMPVEYMLLEHARISDEVGTGMGARLAGYDMPRAVDLENQQPELRDFLEQCDGVSTIQEIADRLGWPLSKCRGVIGEYVSAGLLRVSGPRELLAASQRELELGRAGRAASRLCGWLERSESGAPNAADAQLLLEEWQRERLQKALAVMEPKSARAILRKLDRVESEAAVIHQRWKLLVEQHKQDELTLLHEISLRLASSAPNSRTFADLLRLAHSFHARGLGGRTRMLLRLCANYLPEGAPIRVELGRRMMEAGLMEEGSRWLLNTARELIDASDGESAMLPIRAVLRVAPEHNEARALLQQAQVVQVRRRRRRWSLAVGLSGVSILSLVALVRIHNRREAERWVETIADQDPTAALLELESEFGAEPPQHIADLRDRLRANQAEQRRRLLDSWTGLYRAAEEACRFGDPLQGFQASLELTTPPEGLPSSTPDTTDLLAQLARRLVSEAEELDLPVDASPESLNQEERLLDLLEEFTASMKSQDLPAEAHSFQFRIEELVEEVRSRREQRAGEREQLFAKEREKDQDILLATARAHEQAGDLGRALAAYDRLMESDPALAAIPELQQEIERVRAHDAALQKALALCENGQHDAARASLQGVCPRPIEHLMPYQVDSVPSGARVTLSDGRVRTTPFVAKSGFGERMAMRFELPGFQERTVELQDPRDLAVHMHLFPERSWKTESKIEAAPVPSGDDHIVADRRGTLARIDASSNTAWRIDLKTLGGVARTPVFLPNRSGWLLVVSEDGQVWMVQSQTGELEGPRDIGSPPAVGPKLTRGGVSIQFADGRVALWTDRLEPVFYQADSLVGPRSDRGDDGPSSLVVLECDADRERSLDSPWNGWRVEVLEGEYRAVAPDGRGFSADRIGAWEYVAWEGPKALVPYGRLWVSDGGGLRSYVPSPELMTQAGR